MNPALKALKGKRESRGWFVSLDIQFPAATTQNQPPRRGYYTEGDRLQVPCRNLLISKQYKIKYVTNTYVIEAIEQFLIMEGFDPIYVGGRLPFEIYANYNEQNISIHFMAITGKLTLDVFDGLIGFDVSPIYDNQTDSKYLTQEVVSHPRARWLGADDLFYYFYSMWKEAREKLNV